MPRNLCSRKDWLWFCTLNRRFAGYTGLWDFITTLATLFELNYNHDLRWVTRDKTSMRFEPWMVNLSLLIPAQKMTEEDSTDIGAWWRVPVGWEHSYCMTTLEEDKEFFDLVEARGYTPELSWWDIETLAWWMVDSFDDLTSKLYSESYFLRTPKVSTRRQFGCDSISLDISKMISIARTLVVNGAATAGSITPLDLYPEEVNDDFKRNEEPEFRSFPHKLWTFIDKEASSHVKRLHKELLEFISPPLRQMMIKTHKATTGESDSEQ